MLSFAIVLAIVVWAALRIAESFDSTCPNCDRIKKYKQAEKLMAKHANAAQIEVMRRDLLNELIGIADANQGRPNRHG